MPEHLPAAVDDWRARGRMMIHAGQEIFVSETGEGPPVLLLHGFPGSSFDWRAVAAGLTGHRRVVTFDFLGFGLSDKPADSSYSLFEQADLAVAVATACGIERCALVAHDMGDTVAAELLVRQAAGELPFVVEQVVLTNGSIFIDQAHLTDGQLFLLSLPDEPLTDGLPAGLLAGGLAETFPSGKAPNGELTAMVALIRHEGGDRLMPRLIRYVEERRTHQERWTAGLTGFPGPLTAIWGGLDPIAVVDMVHRLLELRPQTEVEVWPDVGHWPLIESPDRLAEAILKHL
ncbi:alpha/beta fold hydrolase [Planobispora siamensis]|uniref:Putative hydrolase LipZ n=1 Tax=Planobispora siamensis TaxID=936338 RepID=A0A8J3SJT5_9ACTN|nr:alpha/beta hydrolase [Planobispora siamensis]GIH93549.1 putative hydrolase LipZ [Planobispora siamensis]